MNISEKSRHLIPNLLTFFRLFSSPIFAILFFFDDNILKLCASILFLASGISDFLDGLLARKWNVESKIGEIFDPIADKLIVICAIIMLIYQKSIVDINIFAGLIIIMREIFISGLRESVSELNIKISVSFLGKIKTTLQIISITGLVISSLNFENLYINKNFEIIGDTGLFLLWVSAFLSLYSGFEYLRHTIKLLKKKS